MKDNKIEYFAKLISSFVPREAKDSIFKTFGSYNRNKIGCVLGGLEIVTKQITPQDPEKSGDVINALMLGVMLSEVYEDDEIRKIIFDKYFSLLDAQLGKNIIDFNEKKNMRLL